jgi:hypothetical protein
MAAGVAQTREGVVLGEEGYMGMLHAAARLGAERGLEPRDPCLDGESAFLEVRAEPFGGLAFLKSDLGIGVDPLAQRNEVVSHCIDFPAYAILERGQLHHAPDTSRGLVSDRR